MNDEEMRAVERGLAASPDDTDLLAEGAALLEAAGRDEEALAWFQHLSNVAQIIEDRAREAERALHRSFWTEQDVPWQLPRRAMSRSQRRRTDAARAAVEHAHAIWARAYSRGRDIAVRLGIANRDDAVNPLPLPGTPSAEATLARLVALAGATADEERSFEAPEGPEAEAARLVPGGGTGGATTFYVGKFRGADVLIQAEYWVEEGAPELLARDDGGIHAPSLFVSYVLHSILITTAFGRTTLTPTRQRQRTLRGDEGHVFVNAQVQFGPGGGRPHVHQYAFFHQGPNGRDVRFGHGPALQEHFAGPLHILTLSWLSRNICKTEGRPSAP